MIMLSYKDLQDLKVKKDEITTTIVVTGLDDGRVELSEFGSYENAKKYVDTIGDYGYIIDSVSGFSSIVEA